MNNFLLMFIAILIVAILSIPLIIINTLRKLYRREKIKEYFKVIALGFDQAGGSILYGQEDWTVSSWTYHLYRCGNSDAYLFMRFIDWVFGAGHCEESFYNEAQKMRFIPEWM